MRNNLTPLIREASICDAKELLLLTKENLTNSSYLVLQPNEFNFNVKQEEEWIENFNSNSSNLIIVAVYDNLIIGNLTFQSNEGERVNHSGEIAMAIKKEFRNKGVGSLLLAYFFNWVKLKKIIKVNLAVNELNHPAIHLYKKFGFNIEGIQKKEFLTKKKYTNKILMGKLL